MKEKMKYKEIFSDDFLDYFWEYKEKIKDISLDGDEFKIDLDKIANILGVSIEIFDGEYYSGQYNSDEKKIHINGREPIYRQRFTTAHELGHCVLGHNGVSHRYLDSSEYTFTDSINERAANRFATLLLMPKTLLALAFNEYKEERESKGYGMDVDSLVDSLSEMLGVSKQTMRYRLLNLGVISD